MSNLEQFIGANRPPATIVNGYSAGGTSNVIISAAGENHGKKILSGALTATVYKELVSVTGAGFIDLASAYALDATARTIGLKVVMDGVTAFDAVSASLSGAYQGIIAIGSRAAATGGFTNFQRFYFNTSLSLQVKSSLNETDLVELNVFYGTM